MEEQYDEKEEYGEVDDEVVAARYIGSFIDEERKFHRYYWDEPND